MGEVEIHGLLKGSKLLRTELNAIRRFSGNRLQPIITTLNPRPFLPTVAAAYGEEEQQQGNRQACDTA
jgi:hypothetical protein